MERARPRHRPSGTHLYPARSPSSPMHARRPTPHPAPLLLPPPSQPPPPTPLLPRQRCSRQSTSCTCESKQSYTLSMLGQIAGNGAHARAPNAIAHNVTMLAHHLSRALQPASRVRPSKLWPPFHQPIPTHQSVGHQQAREREVGTGAHMNPSSSRCCS